MPCRSAMTILITPATPGGRLGVADVRLQRAEPQRPVRRAGPGRRWPAAPAPRSGRRAWCRCRAPRPRPRRPASSPASASACRMTRCWAGPFGAVRPLLAPSWLTALPRITASTGWPVRGGRRRAAPAGARRRPRPSRCRRPSAENALHRPSAASPRCRLNSTNIPGVAITVDAAGQRQRALAAPQRLRRQVQRDQRGRAGGVHGDRRALQAEGVGDPAGGDAERGAGQQVAVGRLRSAGAAAARSRRPSRRRTRRCGVPRSDAGSIPARSSASQADLQQQPLLRVHRQRLARADPEERRRRTGRRRAGTRRAGCRWCPAVRAGVVQARRGPSRGRPGTRRSRRAPAATSRHRSSGEVDPAGEAAAHRRRSRSARRRPPPAGRRPARPAGPASRAGAAGRAGGRRAGPGSGGRTAGRPAAAARSRARAGCAARPRQRVEARGP